MRFIVMHKVDAHMEAGGPPSAEIVKNMGALVGESLKSGVFTDGAGLHRSALRVRVTFRGGACEVTKGPFGGGNELVARFAMLEVRSMEDAVEEARRFAAILGDGEIEIGPVVEPWDIGVMPKPERIERSKFLLLFKADAGFEAGEPPSAERVAAVTKLTDELARRGVLLKTEGLTPSSQAARRPSGPKGKRSFSDGPFAESKELIAGFSVLNVPSRADAIAWAERYAAILDGNEVDVRPLAASFFAV